MCHPLLLPTHLSYLKPFVIQKTLAVEALRKMGKAVGVELQSSLIYYGERPESPEAPKPEDFFSLVISFSTSLQVSFHF